MPGPTRNIFNLGIIALLIGACAQITAPTGGPRDAEPPKIIRETPPNRSTQFRSKEVDIEFDEFIQLQNIQAVVISPNLDPQPEISARKQMLHIKFKSQLDTNTTYSFFFGNAVGDINENNKLDNYSYVFSTGIVLDSLVVEANVQATEGDIPDNSYLLLYRETDDSAFLKERPFYLSKIGKNGTVKIEHVKGGTYKAYTLCDKNLNYYYDLPSEQIGFLDSAVMIRDSVLQLQLPLFLPEASKLRVTDFDKRIQGGMFRITLNKSLSLTADEIRVFVASDTTLSTVAFPEAESKQLMVYLPDLPQDSVSYTLLLEHNGQLIDSLQLRCDSRRFGTPARYFNDTNALKNLSVLETQPLMVRSTYYAMLPVDTARIRLVDSLDQALPFSISRDPDLRTYLVHADWTDKMNYRLIFEDSAITDLAGNVNALQEIRFAGVSRKKAGSLLLHVELPHTNNQSIIRLKDSNGKLVREVIVRDSLVGHLDLALLPAGTYQVEAIDDVNDNGIWNSGNYSTKTLPEKIFRSTKPILIKENWDAEETIQVDYSQVLKLQDASVISPQKENPAKTIQQKIPGQRMQQE